MKKYNVFVLSGFGRVERSYNELVETAPENTKVHVVPYTQLPLNIGTIAQDVNNSLRRLEVTSAHFVGHSLGGIVGMQLAVLTPECMQSLTLIDSAGIPISKRKLIEAALAQSVLQFPL